MTRGLAAGIAAVLRGGATPTHVGVAWALGAVLGFLPWTHPGLLLAVLVGTGITLANVNLGCVAVGALAAKAISGPLVGVSFALGRVLIDGPLCPLFVAAINAPVLALLGLERYAATGGLAVGAILGSVAGLAAARAAATFRGRLAGLEEGSQLYGTFLSRRVVRAQALVFFALGPRGRGWKRALALARPGPWRRGGPVLVAAVWGVLALAAWGAQDRLWALWVADSLSGFVGGDAAAGVAGDPATRRLDFRRITVPDRADAGREWLFAEHARAEGVRLDPWRGRVSIDRIVVTGASLWPERAGRRWRAAPTREPPPVTPLPGERCLAELVPEPGPWFSLASLASQTLECLGRTPPDEPGAAGDERLGPRLWREAASVGLGRVTASHLVRGRPRLLIRDVEARGVIARSWGGREWAVRAQNLSTNPWLVGAAAWVEARSADGLIEARAAGPAKESRGEPPRLGVRIGPVAAGEVLGALSLPAPRPVGGTLTLAIHAPSPLSPRPALNATLLVRAEGSALDLGAGEPVAVPPFTLRVAVHGPVARPAFSVTMDEWARALGDAGVNDATGLLRAATRGGR